MFQGNERFRILGQLGRGGMGIVYRVFDAQQDCEVALKRAARPDARALYRLKREFRARAGLAHPNLVELYELVADGDSCFFTMELVDGVDLLSWVRGSQQDEELLGDTVALGEADPDLVPTVSPSSAPVPPPVPDSPTVPEPGAVRRRAAGGGAAGGFDLEIDQRLRTALAGLLGGLEALHGAGQIHRDIKPSNVIVRPDGHVTILDFGLASSLSGYEGPASTAFAGTPVYMAPEQMTGHPSAASDLYSVGVMIYEAMTGRPPFEGSLHDLMTRKHGARVADPRDLHPGLPDDLCELTLALLDGDPDRRPDAREALARLESRGDSRPQVSAADTVPFVGRTEELDLLRDAVAHTGPLGSALLVEVAGPTGSGKTRLVRRFLEELPDEALVMGSVCSRSESVPFQGVDAIVDRLAVVLLSMTAIERARVLPRRTFALRRLFQTMAQIPEIEEAGVPMSLRRGELDPGELRRVGFRALRELLGRIAEERPVALWIDDFQWADRDSVELLLELVGGDDPPPLLVLVGYRSDDEGRTRAMLEAARLPASRRRSLHLSPLSDDEVGTLLRVLAPETEETHRLAAIERSEGNAHVVLELGRYLASLHDDTEALPDDVLGSLLRHRLGTLDQTSRRMVERVALADLPLTPAAAIAATGSTAPLQPMIRRLCDGHLLRETDSRTGAITIYHESLREIVVGALEGEGLREAQGSVAAAIEEHMPDALEALLVHWAGAGDVARATHHGLAAAERASRALAFDLAASLWERSLELVPEDERTAEQIEGWANALAHCGRGLEAAEHLLVAAERSDRPEAALLRRRRAAELLIKAGYTSRGWAELRRVMEDLGLPIPRSQIGCLASAAWRRIAFLLRGAPDSDEAGRRPEPGPEETVRLETLWIASTSLSMLNHTLSDCFRMRHMSRVLATGSPSMICRVLAYEVAMESHLGGSFFRRNAEKLLDRVETIAGRTGDPYDEGWRQLAIANYWFTASNWYACVQAARLADEIFSEECVGASWERSTCSHFLNVAQAQLGEVHALGRSMEAGLARAEANADVYDALNHLCPEPVLAWIARGRGDWARRRIEDLHAGLESPGERWPDNVFRAGDAHRAFANALVDYSEGDAASGHERLCAAWPGLESSFILRLQHGRLCYPFFRSLGALGRLASEGEHGSRRQLLRQVETDTRGLEKDRRVMAQGLAAHLRAGRAVVLDEPQKAIDAFREALGHFDAELLALAAQSCRWALVHLGTDPDGVEAGTVRSWLDEQQVTAPEALLRVYLPFLPGALGPGALRT